MKKRLLSILLCAILALSMIACGSKEEPAEEPAETTEEGTEAKYGLEMDQIVVAISSDYDESCVTTGSGFL